VNHNDFIDFFLKIHYNSISSLCFFCSLLLLQKVVTMGLNPILDSSDRMVMLAGLPHASMNQLFPRPPKTVWVQPGPSKPKSVSALGFRGQDASNDAVAAEVVQT
jgi:hypothetical protein